jgi:hypothetical protein
VVSTAVKVRSIRLLSALLGVGLAIACRSEGSVALRFQIEDLPADLSGLFLHVQVRDADGDVLGGSVTAAAREIQLALSVPHGDDRVAVVELRDGASSSASNVIAYGVSAPFSLTVGEDTMVDAVVVMQRVPALLSITAPDVVRDPTITVTLTADRSDVASIVLAQDPSLTYGRQVYDADADLTVTYDLDAPCRPTNTCTDGRRNVFARLVDRAGYSSTATSAPVFVDTEAPRVLPGSGTVQFLAPAGLLTPTAAGAGVTVRLAFVLDEAVTSTPTVVLADSGLPFELVRTELGAYIFERTVAATDPTGPQRPLVTARDVAGNEAPRLAPQLEYAVEHEAPGAPAVDVPGAVVYHRDPYRVASEGGASFRVVGAAGAVEGGARVVVYDRAEAFVDGVEVATRSGAATAEPDGSFVVPLAPVDLEAVYILALDTAGNFDAQGTATRVRDVEWRIPAGSSSGARPPIDVFTVDRLDDTTRLDREGTFEVDPSVIDGGVEAHYDPRWSELLPTASPLPDALRFSAVANDTARGRLVVHAGRSAGDVVRSDTWEWDGRMWQNLGSLGTPPACDDGTADGDDAFGLATYDGALGLSLVVCRHLDPRQAPPLPAGGVDVMRAYGWDGARWRTVDIEAATAPGGRTGAALAYDPTRGRTVMFGGNRASLVLPGASATTLGDTWELEAVPAVSVGARARMRWIERTGGPPARDRHAMVYAPGLGGVAMFGGISAAPDRHALDDLWIWDGTTWTEVAKTGAWPPARALHTLVYDPRSQSVGVLGGVAEEPASTDVDLVGEGLDDAWWFDGATWTQTGTIAGAARGPGLVASGMRSRSDVYVVSGVTPGAAPSASRTFVVDPVRWSDRTPSSAVPPQNIRSDLTYDPIRDLVWYSTYQVVSEATTASETWLWSESGWRVIDRDARLQDPIACVFDRRDSVMFQLSGAPVIRIPDQTPSLRIPPPFTAVNGGAGWSITSTTVPVLGAGNAGTFVLDDLLFDHARMRPVVLNTAGQVQLPNGTFGPPTSQELHVWVPPEWVRIDQTDLLVGGPNEAVLPNRRFVEERWTGRYFLQTTDGEGRRTFTFDGAEWTERSGTEGSWSVSRGVVAVDARRHILTFGGTSRRAATWSWNGDRYRPQTTAGPAPPAVVGRSLAYDERRRRVVVVEPRLPTQSLDAPAGAAFLLDVDPDATPAIVVRARLDVGGVAPGLVQGVRVRTVAGGVGFASTSSAASDGVSLSAYDRRGTRWEPLAASASAIESPSEIDLLLSDPQLARVTGASNAEIRFALQPAGGLGRGEDAPTVLVERFEVVVQYRLPTENR